MLLKKIQSFLTPKKFWLCNLNFGHKQVEMQNNEERIYEEKLSETKVSRATLTIFFACMTYKTLILPLVSCC